MDHGSQIIDNIKKRIKFKRILVLLCIATLICGILSFLFYGLDATSNAIKFISKKNQIDNVEKVMLNPKIKFEHRDGEFVAIEAKKAVHKNKEDIELCDVKASGSKGSITAGRLLITDSGNDLHFSNNPVLIIRETK